MIFPPPWGEAFLLTLRRERHRLPMAEAIRGGIVCVIPVLLAALFHQPLFCWSAIASFWTCLVDESQHARHQRVVSGIGFGLLGGFASGLAIFSRGFPLLSILLTIVIVFLGGLQRSRGSAAGMRGLLLATTFAVSAVFPVQGLSSGLLYGLYFLAGSTWAAVCGAALWQHAGLHRVQKAAIVYFSGGAMFLSRLLASISGNRLVPQAGRGELRARLDAFEMAIVQVYGELSNAPKKVRLWFAMAEHTMPLLAGLESLLSSEASWHDRQNSALRLGPPLKQLASIFDAHIAAIDRGERWNDQELAHRYDLLDRELNASYALFGIVSNEASEWGQACLTVMTRIGNVFLKMEDAVPGPTQARQLVPPQLADQSIFRHLLESLCSLGRGGSPWARHAARVALGAAIAVALANHFSLPQGNWLVLTVLFTMQPSVAHTLQVSRQRVFGTVLGAILASALGLLTHNSVLLACAILPLATGTLASRALSYLSFTLFLTPHFILAAQLASAGGTPWVLAILRIANSIGGVLLGVVISLLVLPDWEKHRLSDAASNALQKTLAYILSVVNTEDSSLPHKEGQQAAAMRREACLAIDRLEAVLLRMRFEPFVQTHLTSSGWIVVAQLKKLTGVVTLLERDEHPLSPSESDDLIRLVRWAQQSMNDRNAAVTAMLPNRWESRDTLLEPYLIRYICKSIHDGVLATISATVLLLSKANSNKASG